MRLGHDAALLAVHVGTPRRRFFSVVTPAKAGVQGKRRSGRPGFPLSRE